MPTHDRENSKPNSTSVTGAIRRFDHGLREILWNLRLLPISEPAPRRRNGQFRTPGALAVAAMLLGLSLPAMAQENSPDFDEPAGNVLPQHRISSQSNPPSATSGPQRRGGDESNSSDDGSTSTASASTSEVSTTPEILELVNKARSEDRTCGDHEMPAAPPLKWHNQLAAVAARHSRDMADNDFFSHTGSDHSRPADRINAITERRTSTAENIAKGQRSVESVMNSWLGSPGHCRNIMNATYTHLGVARSRGSNVWTMKLSGGAGLPTEGHRRDTPEVVYPQSEPSLLALSCCRIRRLFIAKKPDNQPANADERHFDRFSLR